MDNSDCLAGDMKIFVVGAGSMAEAFIRGITVQRVVSPRSILIVNRSHGERLQWMHDTYGVETTTGYEGAAQADLIVLSVKPKDAEAALAKVAPYLHGQPLLSFAAGIPIQWLEARTLGRSPVIRTMPNIPMAVLSGATAVSYGKNVKERDCARIRHLLEQVGVVVEMEEHLMDAATAFSGSGPGIISYFLESMENAAVALGFDAETARKLLLQTVVGTAKTLHEWGISPNELRRRVTSEGGTTFAGVQVMDRGRMPDTVTTALAAAAQRSREMGKVYTEPHE